MGVFRDKSTMYNDDYEIKQRIEEDTRNFESANTAFQESAQRALRYYAGDQYAWNDFNYGSDVTRKFVFNLTRRFVEMPAGYYMQHPKSMKAIPRENGDQETSDIFSKVLSFVETNGNLQNVLQEAFTFGTLVTGLNLIEMFLDYTEDPVSGDIKFNRVAQSSIIMDPYFRKMDLSDCSSIRKRSYITRDQAKILLPEYAKEIQRMSSVETRDGNFQFMPENYNFDTNRLLPYDEYHYLDTREQRVIIDKNTQQKIEWVGNDEMLRYVMQQSPDLETFTQIIPTVNQAILLNERLYYQGKNLLNIDKYPYSPMMGYFTSDLKENEFKIQGLVKGLIDPQYLFNRRQLISLDLLESRSTSGYIVVEGSVTDPDSLFGTGQGQVIWRKQGSKPEDIVPIQPTDISAGMAKVTEDMSNLLKSISGIPDEALGQASDDIPGILAMMRQGASLTVIQRFFNNADFCLGLIGEKCIDVIQNNYTPGKIKRITEKEPTQQFYDKTFGKYDVLIEEGVRTSTQRQQQFSELVQIKQSGIMSFPELDKAIFESSSLQNKNELIEGMMKSQQAQQQQAQMQMQIQMQEQQAAIKMAEAQANYQNSGAIERTSRVPENISMKTERDAQAQLNKQQALLNHAKTIKELQDIDLRQIEQILKIAKMLQEDVNLENEAMNNIESLRNMSEIAQPPASGLGDRGLDFNLS